MQEIYDNDSDATIYKEDATEGSNNSNSRLRNKRMLHIKKLYSA